MNAVVQQDTDSGKGVVITPGEPVDHTDILDGQSAGSIIEPEGDTPPEIHEPGQTVSTKPGELSRDDIYSKATETRDIQDAVDAEEMTPVQRAHVKRMKLEAAGIDPDSDDDPFDGDGNLKEGWVDTGATPEQVVAPGTPIVTDTTAIAEASATTAVPTLDPNAETVTIIVYGEKRDVPRAEVEAAGGVANYQKGVAADERMKRASTYEASLRAYDQELQARAAQPLPTPPATGTTADPDLPPTGDQGERVDMQGTAERLVGAMYSGDREAAITEAAEVLTSFRDEVTRSVQQKAGQPAQGPSPEELQLANQRAAQAERDRLDANTVFVDEFSDLSSPVLRNATYQMVQEVAADPIMYGRPLAEITREAGMRVRKDVFGDDATPEPTPNPTPPAIVPEIIPAAPVPGTDLATRMALKKRTVVQPLIPAQGRFVDTASVDQKPETNSEYINRMRAESRGQPRQ